MVDNYVLDRNSPDERLVESQFSIVVLPFVTNSSDSAQQDFAAGLSEELMRVLDQIDGLNIRGRRSAFTFRGSDQSLADIAASYAATHVLEGRVQRDGDRIRVTPRLTDARSGQWF